MQSALVIASFAFDLFHLQSIDPGVCTDHARVSLRWRQVAILSRSHEVLIYRQQGLSASSSEHRDPRNILVALGGSRCRSTLISGVRPVHNILRCSQTQLPTVSFFCAARSVVQKKREKQSVIWSEKETLGRSQNLQRNEQFGGIP